MRRLGVGFVLALAVCASAAGATGPAIRQATAADLSSRAGDALHTLQEWWTILAFDPKTGDFVYVRLIDKPTPGYETWFRSGGSGDSSWNPALTQMSQPGAAVAFARPDAKRVTLTRTGPSVVFDSADPTASGHIVLHASAHGITAGPWRLASTGVGGPPPTPVPGTLLWSVQVPAGSASGWLQLPGRARVSFRGWSAYVDHWWGAFDKNWFHGDFGVAADGGTAWALLGVEPGTGAYRWEPSDKRWQGVLVRTSGGRAVACRARVARSGWWTFHVIGDGYTYRAPVTVRASCGGISHTFRRGTIGTDEINGIVRAGGPTRDGLFQHLTPAFG